MISYCSHLYALAKHIASQIPQVSNFGQWGVDTEDVDYRENLIVSISQTGGDLA